VRGFRGAICVANDDAEEIRAATAELITEMMRANDLQHDDLVSIILTGTPDITSVFPAEGARRIGLVDVPLLCAAEMDVTGALGRVIRVLIHAESNIPRSKVVHVYLRGAEVLRQDLSRD
jgi:chorismate mutase